MDSEPSILGKGWSETEVRHFVGECYDRDTNLSVLLGYSAKYLEKRMILILGKKILQPFMIQGWERSPEELKSARISRGEMPTALGRWAGEKYSALFDVLGIDLVPELSAIPIPIGNRVTTMILGVPSEDDGFEALSEIAKFVGTQLEKLIRLSKTGELPPKEDRIPASPIRKANSEVSNETLQAYVLEATEIDIPIVPKLVEHNTSGDMRRTLTLGNGLNIGPSEVEDGSPFRVVSESSENDEYRLIHNTLPNISGISEMEDSPFRIASESSESGEQHLDINVSSEMEDASPFHVVSEPSEIEEQPVESGSTTFGLPLIEKIKEISFTRRSSVNEVDDGLKKRNMETAFDGEIESTDSQASTGVAIMVPKQVNEETSQATLMGGIGVTSELLEKSLRETAVNPAVSTPSEELKRSTPGAAIFRARRKSGKVGGFIPQATKVLKTIKPLGSPAPEKAPAPEKTPASQAKTSQTPAVSSEAPSPEIPVLIIPQSRQTLELDEFPAADIAFTHDTDKDTKPELPPNVPSDMKRKMADTKEIKKWDIRDDSEDFGDWDIADDDDDALNPAVFDNLTPYGGVDSVKSNFEAPLAVENQEYLLMIDSRDKEVAFSAAEKIAALGEPALPFLGSIFPGRIFIDRYQFTASTMPNASLHTPVLDCLTRIGGDDALEIVLSHLDDKSTETRFYAVFLLMNFDCGDRVGEIYERFFDKDQQIQDVAKLVLSNAKETSGFRGIIDRLRNETQFSQKDHRVEIACEILALMKDRQSVELFIDLLEEQKGRTQTRIHHSLQVLTLKDWSTPYEWRQWWGEAHSEPRSDWLIAALDSNSEFIRKVAFDELQRIPGLALNYHVMQPSKLRRRAQRELRSWFDSLG